MTEARGLGREALLYAMAKLINGAAGFAAIYIFTRLLLPADYGYYYVVLSAVEITAALCFAWINLSLVRFYPGMDQSELPVFFGRLVAANITVSALLIILGLLCAPVLMVAGLPAWLPFLVLAVALPQSWMGFAQNLFRSQRRPLEWLLTTSAMSIARLCLGWWALSQISATGVTLVLVQSVAVFGAAVYALARLKQPLRLSRDSFDWRQFMPVVKYGLPLSLVSSGSWLMISAGRLVLGAIAGTEAVGVFAAAYQLAANLMQVAVQPIALASEAVAFRVYEREGPAPAKRYMQNYVGLLLTVSTAVGLVLYLLRIPVVTALVDHRYATAAGLIGILAPAIVLIQAHSSLARSFEFVKRTTELAKFTLSAGGVNLLLNLALVPLLAEVGSAISSLACYALYVSMTYLGGRRHFPWPLPWRTALALVVPAALVVLLNAFLGAGLDPRGIWQTAFLALVYVICYLAIALATFLLFRKFLSDQVEFIMTIFHVRADTR